MIIEKHTQQSDLTKPKGKTEIVYTIKPEDNAEDIKINNFINSQKIPKTTLEDFKEPLFDEAELESVVQSLIAVTNTMKCNCPECKALRGEL